MTDRDQQIKRPLLKDAERLHRLLSELSVEAIRINEIEVVLARIFTDGYDTGWSERQNEN